LVNFSSFLLLNPFEIHQFPSKRRHDHNIVNMITKYQIISTISIFKKQKQEPPTNTRTPQTVDTNSAYLAKFCFSLGINLKRIEVIGDEESEIVEAVRRMSSTYDFVVTSGGIGPTHDDITYQSIANAFSLPLVLHEDTFSRMKRLSKPHPNQPNFDWEKPSPALEAKKRMVILPWDEKLSSEQQVVFTAEDLWVPVAVVNGNVHILPGVPRLFERMLTGLKPSLLPRLTDPEGKSVYRIIISTPLPESGVASYLTELAKKVEPQGIKVGR
jgi:molybdenum cofactor synthesis domain-containing protein